MRRMKWISVLLTAILAFGAGPAFAGKKEDKKTQKASSRKTAAEVNCAEKIVQLSVSSSAGQERLTEKDDVISFCRSQYGSAGPVAALVAECYKVQAESVVKRQVQADCAIAAYSYANALNELKYGY